MQELFKHGDVKTFTKTITTKDIAAFETGVVHDVYATFCLAKDAEWCSRLFVLDMKNEDEEGIGTQLTINHVAPAFVGEEICITTTFNTITKSGEVLTSYVAKVKDRIIATGIQGQKILPKNKLASIFEKYK
jgi:fluoroacetyl-CoA thioesterase